MFEDLMMKINACSVNDLDVVISNEIPNLFVDIDLCDFAGFDDDWEEVMRDFNDEKAIDALLDWLTDSCVSQEDDYYTYYYFDGFTVRIGYTSMDI